MNIITIAEIKRGGMAALDAALNMPQHGGTAAIMKRNRPAAIVLTPQAYAALLDNAAKSQHRGTALDWLLAPHSTTQSQLEAATASPGRRDATKLDAKAMAQRLNELGSEWSVR